MRFIKFVAKTIIISSLCAYTFSIVLEKTLSSQAKEDIKNASNNIVNLMSLEDKASENSIDDEVTSDKELVEENENLADKVGSRKYSYK